MPQPRIYDKIQAATAAIRAKSPIVPEIGVVLGSGLGSLAQKIENPVTIPYTDIPGFFGTSVEGHAGKLIIGHFQGVACVFLQGRFHFYEGYTMEEVVFPTRVICALGIKTLVLTNASGGINTRYRPGDIMVIDDHLNLMGDNPLKGPNLAELGPRFPDMTEAYSKQCNEIFDEAAKTLGFELKHGTYVGLLGPTYETPAEVRMIRTLGGDAVGMSTVPESIAANHLGVRVCGLATITNLAAGLGSQKLTHQEVVDNSKLSVGKLEQILTIAIPKLVFKKVHA